MNFVSKPCDHCDSLLVSQIGVGIMGSHFSPTLLIALLISFHSTHRIWSLVGASLM